MPTHRPLTVLDVGGTWEYWRSMPWQTLQPCTIELLNPDRQVVLDPSFTSVIGDARNLSRYADQSFDVVFSHSVIGHVGTWNDQQQMARELLRVGNTVILQTPNHRFPIDWRTLVPAFHFLPPSAQAWCFAHAPIGRYSKAPSRAIAIDWATRVRNLTESELRTLFPDGVIVRERITGFTKSFIVINAAIRTADKTTAPPTETAQAPHRI